MDNYLGYLCKKFSETDPSLTAFQIYDGKEMQHISYQNFLSISSRDIMEIILRP